MLRCSLCWQHGVTLLFVLAGSRHTPLHISPAVTRTPPSTGDAWNPYATADEVSQIRSDKVRAAQMRESMYYGR